MTAPQLSSSLLDEVLAERFPTAAQVEQELAHPVPAATYAKGREGLTRLEVLLLKVRSGR